MPSFTMDDGCQPPREFASKDCRLIAATYNDFLLRNIGERRFFLTPARFSKPLEKKNLDITDPDVSNFVYYMSDIFF